jgi:hypothetical protein
MRMGQGWQKTRGETGYVDQKARKERPFVS